MTDLNERIAKLEATCQKIQGTKTYLEIDFSEINNAVRQIVCAAPEMMAIIREQQAEVALLKEVVEQAEILLVQNRKETARLETEIARLRELLTATGSPKP